MTAEGRRSDRLRRTGVVDRFDGAVMLTHDEEYLRVRDEDDDDGRAEVGDVFVIAKAQIRQPVPDRHDDVGDRFERPAHAGRVGGGHGDDGGDPDAGDDDVPQTVGQHGRVRQRTDDDVALERQHRRQTPDGTVKGDVREIAENEDERIRDRDRLDEGVDGVDEDRQTTEVGRGERQHHRRDDVLASSTVSKEEDD